VSLRLRTTRTTPAQKLTLYWVPSELFAQRTMSGGVSDELLNRQLFALAPRDDLTNCARRIIFSPAYVVVCLLMILVNTSLLYWVSFPFFLCSFFLCPVSLELS
jgi:hypothetical protein